MEFTPGEYKSNVRSVDCCHGDDRIYSMRRNDICGHGERSVNVKSCALAN